MDNKDLQSKYEEMHKQGVTAWFSDGKEERETILKMGEPWDNKFVVEIGCGEGDLAYAMHLYGAFVTGWDYSLVAIEKAAKKYNEHVGLRFIQFNYNKFRGKKVFNRIVMQGVLEHLDDPFTELKWMMDNLLGEHGDVITSSPCFLNPRGIVWMTLDMLGAVMSKTDLHYLHKWQFEDFCLENKYKISMRSCDWLWGNDMDMINDLRQRIPLALKDGNLLCNPEKIDNLLKWLYTSNLDSNFGATMVYRITK